jgi:hypothetical protein
MESMDGLLVRGNWLGVVKTLGVAYAEDGDDGIWLKLV